MTSKKMSVAVIAWGRGKEKEQRARSMYDGKNGEREKKKVEARENKATG